ncbi:hypothetical protein GLYMA_15G219700v4 [Glycine max]|uniref:Uncharacterized protein n=2 Tax=Glycine subgen. Soja TaxID=1462606 RepID=K7MCZ9_SOYBN|nr:uncharacterized protein LOC100805302 isoform X2 [Glycine max]XP_006598031.1 uncharacterized protein LOC100805302 isoform X2 [Glycine max]XP_025981523.1 uncharacterized protein LOC100805302 isoform X2 [Glycine max]XP_028205127.1 uncharacterized protein LOC114388693 isoform X2 [Glycine soja]XP_028205128.1 uncharacterized protein LOC114388693 isoform X2 [Glycine soja]XP_028205129.1 uncharacterized protein LOC114388693 isoform X2 [Glycine soja]KAG4950029.1 hypothetical protein JHK86_043268 [Gl|eukprot:XP_006598030.1 uncharacterized protein LOC100805302 isoform X2 [Glycine max]
MTLFIKQLLPITDQNWAVKVWQKLQAQVDKLSDARLEEAFYQNTKALQSFQCLDANTYRRSMILKANILLAKLQFLNFKAAPLLDLLVSSTWYSQASTHQTKGFSRLNLHKKRSHSPLLSWT